MSKFVNSLGAPGAIILALLATVALQSLRAAKAAAPGNPLSPRFPIMGAASGRAVPLESPAIPAPTLILAIKGVKTAGALSPVLVRKILTADFPRLTDCCREAARNAVPLPGKITLVFHVGPDGRLTGEPLGKPPLANQKFESLMASAFRTLQFPTFTGAPVQVEVTLALAG